MSMTLMPCKGPMMTLALCSDLGPTNGSVSPRSRVPDVWGYALDLTPCTPGASWFETALSRLLTMRGHDLAAYSDLILRSPPQAGVRRVAARRLAANNGTPTSRLDESLDLYQTCPAVSRRSIMDARCLVQDRRVR